jgi:hypothetical protein
MLSGTGQKPKLEKARTSYPAGHVSETNQIEAMSEVVGSASLLSFPQESCLVCCSELIRYKMAIL